MKKLRQVVKEATVPTTVSYKGNKPDRVLKVDPNDRETVNNLKMDPTTDDVVVGNRKIKEEQAGKVYTKQEANAVALKVKAVLRDTLAANGDEVHNTSNGKPDIQATRGTNKFTLTVNYGDNIEASNDTFKFKLDPTTQSILDEKGNSLVKFQITSGNKVSLPADLLQEKLSELLVKYRDQATAEPQTIPETTKHVGGKYVNYPEKGGKRLGTFSSEKAAKDQLTAIHIKQHQKENLDPVMKEDLDVGHEDNEPHMLKAEIYRIARNSVDLYKALEAFEGHGEVDFPQWWQAKIIKAASDIQCAKEYLEFETKEPAIDAAINTLGEAKSTCCHKCGHMHDKKSPCPTSYLEGEESCKIRK